MHHRHEILYKIPEITIPILCNVLAVISDENSCSKLYLFVSYILRIGKLSKVYKRTGSFELGNK